MASWQAYLTSAILRRFIKPRFARAQSIAQLRNLMRSAPFKVPVDIRITPGTVGGVPGEWVEGSQTSKAATLLYFHGGGYIAMSPKTHRPITAAFARRGFRVFVPSYRLAPEHRFPAAIEDAVACYRALLASGTNERAVVFAGDSAGGGLALSTLLALRTDGTPLPRGCALFSPWTDLAASGASIRSNNERCALFFGHLFDSWVQQYLRDRDPRDPLASPLYADLSAMPPLIIHVGENEVLLDDSVKLAQRACLAGTSAVLKIWPTVHHGWQLAPFIPEARQSVHEACDFLMSAIETAPADRARTNQL